MNTFLTPTVSSASYQVVTRSTAFNDCFFVEIKNQLLPGATPLVVCVSDFCEQWEVGQLMGGN